MNNKSNGKSRISNMPFTFKQFWKRLLQKSRSGGIHVANLGRKGKFIISVSGGNGVCIPLATMKVHWFTKDHANKVWDRFHSLPAAQQSMAGRYVRPRFVNCPNQICSPWIAATIRAFLAGQI